MHVVLAMQPVTDALEISGLHRLWLLVTGVAALLHPLVAGADFAQPSAVRLHMVPWGQSKT